MTRFLRRAAFVAVVAGLAVSAPALAQSHGPIRISDAWCPPPPPGAPTAAGYLTIVNSSHAPDRLIRASSPAAAQVQLHSMATEGRVMRMRPVIGGVAIAAGQTRAIQPGGEMHLMLIGLKRRLGDGDRVPVTLTFARAGAVVADFAVRPEAAPAPPMRVGPHRTDHIGHMDMGGR